MSEKRIFDYIVIGAGTAGGIIANKLTDDKDTSVLVLEAGTNMTDELSSASFATAASLANDNKFSFNILSRTESIIGRQLKLWGGRVIGGSSDHNFMLAVRGSRNLYNEWANLVGSQWSYERILRLFKKDETYTGNTQSPNQRGTKGPIFIRQQIIPNNGLINTLAQATSDVLGIPIVEDYNTGIRDCTFFKSQFTQQEVNGMFVRSSTSTGYLNEDVVTQGNEFYPDEFGVRGRKLVIFAKTTVDKIIFKRKKGRNIAVGVQYVRDGVTQEAFARNEIIISAGILSSVILQRSGIGRPADLAEAGISTLVKSPNVGYNLQAHFNVGIGIEVETSRLLQVLSADPDQPIAIGAFKKEKGPGRRLQLLGLPLPVFLPIQDVLVNQWSFDPTKPSNVMSIGIVDVNPKSKGTIMVAHSDPEAFPSINFNPLENPDDLNFMVHQYIETYKIMMKARELDPDGIYKVVYPPETIFNLTDEIEKRNLLADFARATYVNLAHIGGQCRMGRNIQEGVVDGFLNVFGTEKLRVADLSVAPILPDGNTSIPAQMIGLNAVRFIRKDLHNM
ncbi:choline dehydrogenase-like flavoprotein [Desulfosporosinus orientis DSM 765]|uniref:Choline dehydrogenase-like flavoprotein n=1 Tax=Desulfosporosinus orientis (strain ATCC 19365 / DSM 765 / NCIMB 8382 / VKM B-1628 / Singapore I) TaxID=768706 RepID=G7WD28_DESOD|nr:GMC family oxidoreductase [Desulfosporosinus orientis]AET67223.1 choline dehydrogenase-like flavoprotein [Desulfosporosinus orientis DSM 765]